MGFESQCMNGDESSICDPGLFVTYRIDADGDIPPSNVESFDIIMGTQEEVQENVYQWLKLHAVKANGEQFSVWILANEYPSKNRKEAEKSIARYLLQEDWEKAVEYRHQYTKKAVLPELGAWKYLFPQPQEDDSSVFFPDTMNYLGSSYKKVKQEKGATVSIPKNAIVLDLLPDAKIGVPHNQKTIDGTRRYDESDYQYTRLTHSNYDDMIDAGMNCFRVDLEQMEWIEFRNVFYWGIGGADIAYPEHLYRSNYLGPILFIDEPGVCTRDHVIRPRLREDQNFRKSITPQICYEEFVDYFDEAKNKKKSDRFNASPGEAKRCECWRYGFSTEYLYLGNDG